ncbi:sulfurtransferase [Gordonia sp. (in: high G+C Gram-positive bacteria)]|uniref:sulfurtransferase n=1 Tax=Gordonia sp. (in: high G+C Gram-positive bacteria) TaxID=84139 RepID=UPI0016B092F7|nr:sulfurtransferase [Gordonia sp. (in: high G+C Gram-positive bacteria)]NLG47940.1 sulfurtransferase [Gordonia sp. (in: high G+C Gram-positive bacteria)]
MTSEQGVRITVDDLVEAMLSSRPPVVLDVRWQLGDSAGHDHYRAGHLPGSVYVDLDTELAAPPTPEAGRHPLPALADLQAAARRWGIDVGSRVVVYDDWEGKAAARAWWLLRWAGLTDVRILDGGIGAWKAAGMRISTGDATPRVGTVVLTEGHLPTVTIDQVAALDPTQALLLDARATERFTGETEPVDPRPGHIPGAVSAPTGDNVDADGRFLPTAQLRDHFEALGAADREVVVYCGSGVTAAHQIAALADAGIEATLFPGSYSQWSSDASRPVALG